MCWCYYTLHLFYGTFHCFTVIKSIPISIGLLESVSNLTVTSINSTTVLISWSPPFTLERVPILGYNVTITNTTSWKNETMLVEDTALLYSIDHPDPENNFTVTVVPINEVGAGQPATSRPFLFSLILSESVNIYTSIYTNVVILVLLTDIQRNALKNWLMTMLHLYYVLYLQLLSLRQFKSSHHQLYHLKPHHLTQYWLCQALYQQLVRLFSVLWELELICNLL